MDNIQIKLNARSFTKIYREYTCTQNVWKTIFSGLTGFSILIFIPYLHFGVISHLWDSFAYRVDKIGCTCPCWDTVFKGYYERGPAGYKHVYINATSNAFSIWVITISAVLLLYECTKRIVTLYMNGELRNSLAILFCLNVYPHYYSWWAFFNFLNDGFYGQWYHQLYFTITEFLATLVIVNLLDKKTSITTRKLLFIGCIAVLHVILATYDQFVYNILLGNGKLHQILRDFGMMIPDILQIIIPWLELKKLAFLRNRPIVCLISNVEFFTSVLGIFFIWMFGLCI